MSNVYDMSGKKKVIFTKPIKSEITYKKIMQIIIKYATEEGCKAIFSEGGVTLCPSEVFGNKIDKEQEDDDCNYKSIGCTRCWDKAIRKLGLDERNNTDEK